jgi:hypothetical protein
VNQEIEMKHLGASDLPKYVPRVRKTGEKLDGRNKEGHARKKPK